MASIAERGCSWRCLRLSVAASLLSQVAATAACTAAPGKFVTSEAEVRTFPWGPPARTLAEAFADAFDGVGERAWVDINYTESGNTLVTKDTLLDWVENDLLGGTDPFAAHGGEVPVPWPAESGTEDQLGNGQWAGYSRRQICFIVAKSLVGAKTVGYANGLERYLRKTANSGCTPRKEDFGRSFFVLLAACSADPCLASGGLGPLLLAAKGTEPTGIAEVRNLSQGVDMGDAGLRVCEYDDGDAPDAAPPGLDPVPKAGCVQPSKDGPGRDFMTGGLQGQAVQDISAAFLGGYVFGYACGLGGGQDERLMTYMPEVAVFTFFLSESTFTGGDEHPHPQLRQPAWILGARMLFIGLDGTARFNAQMVRDPATPLTGDLVEIGLNGTNYSISSSRPFLAFMSENQGFIQEGDGTTGTRLARKNQNPLQRRATAGSNVSTGFANAGANASFDREVRAWYSAVALTSYNSQVQPALRSLVKSIGTGPWLAGLWWGDSQLGFLAVWLGQAIAAQTWGPLPDGAPRLPVDYYLYSAFTESPGSQCLVLAGDRCLACLQRCNDDPLPDSAFWLPHWAKFGENHTDSCVPADKDLCGVIGMKDVVERYRSASASDLWGDVDRALNASMDAAANMDESVFDLMLAPMGEGDLSLISAATARGPSAALAAAAAAGASAMAWAP